EGTRNTTWYDAGGVGEAEASHTSNQPAAAGGGFIPSEMGVGKGGKIRQKVYDDPHGLDVWRTTPTVARTIHLLDAETYRQITGKTLPKPVAQEEYGGPWYHLADGTQIDLDGTTLFDALLAVRLARGLGTRSQPEPCF